MTFIPLNNKNFVKNKIKSTKKTSFKKSDESTYILDKDIDSKSVINTNKFEDLTVEETKISLNDPNIQIKTNAIENFYRIINNNKTAENYFLNKKRLIEENNLTNENLKDFNFKNKIYVEKVNKEFLVNSFNNSKINTVLNKVYTEYSQNYSFDYYKSLEKGFCNYNTLNFFSKNLEDKKHSNCLFWPNLINGSENQYNFLQNSSTISFYLNIRKEKTEVNLPECVLHVPDYINIYVCRSNNNDNKYRFIVVIGENTKSSINDLLLNTFNIFSDNSYVDSNLGYWITSDLDIKENHWNNISFTVNKKQNQTVNNKDVSLYLNGEYKESGLNLLTGNVDNQIKNRFISIGNKPDYPNNFSYDDLFYMLFGSNYDDFNYEDSTYFQKDIDYGKNYTWEDDKSLKISDIVSQNNFYIRNSESGNFKPESFEGEIHDIRIYSKILNKQKITEISKKCILDIENEVLDFNLCLYIPVFYVPSFIKKNGIFSLNESFDDSNQNLRYKSHYNPYFANACGGMEVSVENYLIEFVNHTKPNVVIGGYRKENFIKEENNTLKIFCSKDNTENIHKIKKGEFSASIYATSIEDSTVEHEDCIMYRNYLILPNDNGLLEINYDIIKNFLNSYQEEKYSEIPNVLYDISIDRIFEKDYFYKPITSNKSYSRIALDSNYSLGGNSLYLPDGSDINFKTNKDMFFNISNYIFHKSDVQTMPFEEDLNISEITSFSIDNLKIQYPIYPITPIVRNYYYNTNLLNIPLDVSYSKTIFNRNVNYLSLPLGYSDSLQDSNCMFNSILDISSNFYNTKIKKESVEIKNDLIGTNKNVSLTFRDGPSGLLYRNDCLTKVAKWNYVGHVFYKEGFITFNRPELYFFGLKDFELNFKSDSFHYVNEINIPIKKGFFNKTNNITHSESLRLDESAFNSEESFVYISDINLHDENLNIIAKSKMAHPAPKKFDDSILFRLKMDF